MERILPDLSPKTVDVVLYHSNCPDGLGAAFPFWRENQDRFNNKELQLIGVTHGINYPRSLIDKRIMMVDFSYKREIIKQICKNNKFVFILDHHRSAIDDLVGLENECPNFGYILNIDKSGAQIVWDWIYPTINAPWFIDYIADRDLWRFKLPHSKEINRGLNFDGFTFYDHYNRLAPWEKMEELMSYTSNDINKLSERGRIVCEVEDREIQAAMAKSILCEFEGYRVRLATCSPHLRSDLGNKIVDEYNDCDFSVVWRYDFTVDNWYISLER